MATRKGCSPSPDDYGTKYTSIQKAEPVLVCLFYCLVFDWIELLLRHELRNHLIDHLPVRLALELRHNSFHNLSFVPRSQ